MKRFLHVGAACVVLAAAAAASDLNLVIRSGGQSVVTVSPGETLTYEIVGELSDDLSEGLALFALDLEFSGGDLAQANEPAPLSTMKSFSRPQGVTNPAGFGGTPDGRGGLRQVGGLQNTIKNTFGSFPIGGVVTGVAAHGFPEILVSGSVTVPEAAGTYVLSASNVRANVIRLGQTGTPFWAVERAGVGSVQELTLQVVSLAQSVPTLSLSAGGTLTLDLDGGPSHAFQGYWLFGSATGSSPGTPLPGGFTLPLNTPDNYFTFTLQNPNTFPTNTLNLLDGNGRSTATAVIPANMSPSLVGVELCHAWLTFLPFDFVSNAVTFVFVP